MRASGLKFSVTFPTAAGRGGDLVAVRAKMGDSLVAGPGRVYARHGDRMEREADRVKRQIRREGSVKERTRNMLTDMATSERVGVCNRNRLGRTGSELNREKI